jgi:hypothetical protein
MIGIMSGKCRFGKETHMVTQVKAETTKSIPTLPELPVVGSLMTYNHDPLNFNLRAFHQFNDIAKFILDRSQR